MSDTLKQLVRAAIEARGATGLVNTGIPCGCGLDDLMPCNEPCTDCKLAYAVLCDGTNCTSCDARSYPPRENFETTCFVPVTQMEGSR